LGRGGPPKVIHKQRTKRKTKREPAHGCEGENRGERAGPGEKGIAGCPENVQRLQLTKERKSRGENRKGEVIEAPPTCANKAARPRKSGKKGNKSKE